MRNLYYLILAVIINIVLYIPVYNLVHAYLCSLKKERDGLDNACVDLGSKEKKIRERNAYLSVRLENIIEIYEVTKDVCKSLDVDEVFEIFKNKLKEYIRLDDCRFLKDRVKLAAFPEYTVLPMNIDSRAVGYLLVKGIIQEEELKFNILVSQFFMGVKRALLYQQVQELAITDGLTSVFARRYFMGKLGEELERAIKFDLKFSFLMIDIDHFKEYNDRFGHLVGDVVLKETAATIKESIREIDIVGRYGGEEFTILLPETSPRNAYYAAERIRKAIAARRIKAYDEEITLTISIGIADFPKDAKDAAELIDNADTALYQAKQKGRNQVCAFSSK